MFGWKKAASSDETDEVYRLAESLTGTCQKGRYRREVLVDNVSKRAHERKFKSIKDYLEFAQRDQDESRVLVSLLTIHTTYWFREFPHYELLEKAAVRCAKRAEPGKVFKLYSSACSTGQEAYSAALILESVRAQYPSFDYEIYGTDIDLHSVKIAQRCLYPVNSLREIPTKLLGSILKGSKEAQGWFTLSKNIRARSRFLSSNLVKIDPEIRRSSYDWIFCRNVLIYFAEADVPRIVNDLKGLLNEHGVLCLGHSEMLAEKDVHFEDLGNSCYRKLTESERMPKPKQLPAKVSLEPKTILVVDDSVVIRKIIVKVLQASGFRVLEAESARQADQMLNREKVNLVTLDIFMPEEKGTAWLVRARESGLKCPVVLVSDADPREAADVLGALETGAQEFFPKSNLRGQSEDFVFRIRELLLSSTHKPTASKKSGHLDASLDQTLSTAEVILLGASTGGPEVLCKILENAGAKNLPPVCVVQHISAAFAKSFAERLGRISGLECVEPKENDPLQPGRLYIAFSDYHLGLKRLRGQLVLQTDHGSPILGHRPAVDFLFRTAAEARAKSLAILLTGMGRDGAEGMLEISKQKQSVCVAQDEASSTVFGMPKEAIELNAAQITANIQEIRELLVKTGNKVKKIVAAA